MFNLIKRYRQIPESKKIIVYGKLAFLKNLFYFAFKIIVGIVFRSWFLIAIALYGLCIGFVKNNCSRGLKRNKDSVKDIFSYIEKTENVQQKKEYYEKVETLKGLNAHASYLLSLEEEKELKDLSLLITCECE